MNFKFVTGKKAGFWFNDSKDELNLLSKFDKAELVIYVVSMILCAIGALMVLTMTELESYYALLILTVPFFILGFVFYFKSMRWYLLAIIGIGTAVALMYFKIDLILVFLIDAILVGSVGVVSLVSAIQRLIFYRVLRRAEIINIKDRMTFTDKVITFIFNIPSDLDTRSITMDYNLNRASIPWKDIRMTMRMGMMIGIFMWIYFSMNPTFILFGSIMNAPMYVFSIVLFIPVIVMPWSIFMSLNVRIRTKYRDFYLYSGIIETLKRIILPMFAALVYLLIAVNKSGFMSVLAYIILSVVITAFIIGLTSLIYYAFFERKIVNDIVSKWKVFRPISLLMEIDDGRDGITKYPGTPVRDTNDFHSLDFNIGRKIFPDPYPSLLLLPMSSGSSSLDMITLLF